MSKIPGPRDGYCSHSSKAIITSGSDIHFDRGPRSSQSAAPSRRKIFQPFQISNYAGMTLTNNRTRGDFRRENGTCGAAGVEVGEELRCNGVCTGVIYSQPRAICCSPYAGSNRNADRLHHATGTANLGSRR